MKNKINLWNRSGCLSREAILALVSKTLTNADKYLIEKHLEECVLCREAFEGYSVHSAENVQFNIENLDIAFEKRFAKKRSSSFVIILSLAAAVVIALIGIFSLIKYNLPSYSNPIAHEIKENNKVQTSEDTVFENNPTQQVPSSPQITKEFKAKNKLDDVNMQVGEETNSSSPVSASEGYYANDMPEKKEESISENDTQLQENVIAYESSSASKKNDNKPVAGSPVRDAKKPLSIEKQAFSETVFYNVEQPALFNGGSIEKFRTYIENKLTLALKEKQVSPGAITVNFTLDTKGFTKDIFIVQSIDAKTDSMVISFIKNTPRWIPAKQDGKAVNVNMVLPLKILDTLN